MTAGTADEEALTQDAIPGKTAKKQGGTGVPEPSLQRSRGLRRPARLRFVLSAFLVALAMGIFPAYSSKVRLLTLEEMVGRAGRIVSGHCLGTRDVLDRESGIAAVLVTVRVDQRLKGDAPPILIFKVPAAASGQGASNSAFVPGEDLILLLYPESPSGFTSPIGFGQGKFVISKDKSGRKLVRNAAGNKGLFVMAADRSRGITMDAAMQATPSAQFSPEALIDAIRSLVERSRSSSTPIGR